MFVQEFARYFFALFSFGAGFFYIIYIPLTHPSPSSKNMVLPKGCFFFELFS